MKSGILIKTVCLALTLFSLIPEKAYPIPAFARKYQISCQVCHSPAPRIKPFGEEFAGNGFRLTEYESPRYFIQSGDEKLSLLRELPVAIRFDGIATVNFNNRGTFDFGTPYGIKLLSGGELSEKISYYFYFFMSEAGEIAGLEDAFIMYHDLFGTGINIYFGQFQACDPLYKRELRLTLEDVHILKAQPGNSSVSLKYERGIMFDYEIPGLQTAIVGEIVNGSGIGPGDESLFDKDKFKNLMGRVSQPIGKSLSIGIFGYIGREKLVAPSVPAIMNSDIRMFGPTLNLDLDEKLMINMLYMKRSDSWVFNESLNTMMPEVSTRGGFAEVILAPKGDMSKSYFTGLLNWIDSDYEPLNYKSATINYGYLLRRNLRLVAEYTWLDGEDEYGRLSFGFVSAF